MFYVYFFFAALLIFLSYRSFRGGIGYLRYFKHEVSRLPGSYAPFASVIIPCKGLDDDLVSNLIAVLEQDYPSYEVIFVVDSENDPAVSVIENVSRHEARHVTETKLVVATRSAESSQKVENLREAVQYVSDDAAVFVFVDSDTRVAKDWLRHLVAPLADTSVGAATGYRWFIPEHLSFASEIRSVWNASIASALGPNLKSNFCWGGSTAIRRETFDKLNIRERWRGTLSDDFTVTRAVKQAGLSVYFVPKALTVSTGLCTLRELVEFTNRQMKITRVYSPGLWMMSFFGSVVFSSVMFSSLLIVILGRRENWNATIAGIIFLVVAAFSIGKSWYRMKAVGLVLEEDWPEVDRQWMTHDTLWLLTPVLFLINCIAATFSRRVTWRGTQYELKSPTETVIIAD